MADSGKEGIEAVRERWPVLFNARKLDELGDWFYAGGRPGAASRDRAHPGP